MPWNRQDTSSCRRHVATFSYGEHLKRILLAAALLLWTMACTKTVTAPNNESPIINNNTATNANVAGSWVLAYASGPTRYTVALTQVGTAVSGTLTGGGPDYSRWSVSGAVQGNTFSLNYITDLASGQSAPAGAYYHTGTVSADGKTIVGSRTATNGTSTTYSMTR